MVVVTGAAGFIGSALVAECNRRGRSSLLLVDQLGGDQRFRNLCGLAFADFCPTDEFLARVERDRGLPRLEAVIHLGACSATTEPDGDFLMRNNFAYTRDLATWSLRHGVRFIYASSAATYGDGTLGYSDDPALLPRLRPLNKYAFSKHAMDLWALHSGAFQGPGAITGLKYFNVYGPNEGHKGDMRSMVLKAFEQIRDSGVVRLFRSYRTDYADGHQKRDFLYVEDAAAMTAWFLENPQATGIYNLGSGQARTWNDLAQAVFAAMGREPRIEYIDMPAGLRSAYQYATCANLSRLRRVGCDLAPCSLEAGVREYVQQYLLGGEASRAAVDPPRQP